MQEVGEDLEGGHQGLFKKSLSRGKRAQEKSVQVG